MDDQDFDRAVNYGDNGNSSEDYSLDVSSRGASGDAAFKDNLIELRRPNRARRSAAPDAAVRPPEIIGSSPQAAALRETIALYAEDEAPVLITGETGAGKELVARHLHALGARRNGAFSPLNAGAMPETLAASELFGHAKGAYTGAVGDHDGAITKADGGVLFLDEIGDMPLSIQTHLLRVLEDGIVMKLGGKAPEKADFRLISATHVDLRARVQEGLFRSDLFYRVHVLVIDVPPLRERGDDVVEIAEAMIASHADERRRRIKLTPKAADVLRSLSLPGNVRELRNIISCALVRARQGRILPEHLPQAPLGAGAELAERFDVDAAKTLASRFVMMKALHASGGNVSKAASLLGRSRSTLHAMMKDMDGKDLASAYRAVRSEMNALLND